MKKKKKIFLTDIDNACLDWSEAMFGFLKKNYPELKPSLKDYSFGLDQDLLDKLWREFNNTAAFDDIKPLMDAQIYLPKIAALGYEFIGITSCLPDDKLSTFLKVRHRRNKNLAKYFGNVFKKCIVIEVHHSKKPYLELFKPTYWVDDKPKHVADGIECGHVGFLMTHNYNEKEYIKGANRVFSWKEIYEEVVKSKI